MKRLLIVILGIIAVINSYAQNTYVYYYTSPCYGVLTAGTIGTPSIPITLTNGQTTGTGTGFQQMITVPSSNYSSYENSLLQNIEFTTGPSATGTVLQAWIESGATSSSGTTVYWLNLGSCSISGTGILTIYMNFMPYNVMSSAGPTGEAPQLSGTYGQYDNGASVFNFYDNFAGPGFNASKWTLYSNGSGTATINSSISISFSSTTNSAYVITSNSSYAPPLIAEIYAEGSSAVTNSRSYMPGLTTTTATTEGVNIVDQTPYPNMAFSNGKNGQITYSYIQGSTGGQSFSNYPGGTPSGYNIIGLDYTGSTNTWYKNYISAFSSGSYSPTGSVYIAVGIGEYGGSNPLSSLYAYWARSRAYPPGNVMPGQSIGTTAGAIGIASIPILLTNNQGTSTGTGFQQMITVNSSNYSSYENSLLQNIEFTTGPAATGTVLQAWIESGATSSSGTTVYWVNLGSGSISANSSLTIYMNFMPGKVMSGSGPTGEAPLLSGSYGQYDNGNKVFSTFYDNFAGSTINGQYTQVIPVGASITQSNGITITTNPSSYWGGLLLTSGFSSSPIQIFDGDVTAVSGVAAGMALQNGNTAASGGYDFNYWGGSVAYGSMSGGMNGNTNPNLQVSAGIMGGVWLTSSSQVWYKNYVSTSGTQSQYSLPGTIYPSIGIYDMSASTSIAYSWVRTRAYPPGGMMPVAALVGTPSGLISSNQTICNGGTPIALMQTTATGGTGNYTYLWYANGSSTGTTTSMYSPGVLTTTKSYYCAVTSVPCGTVTTNTVTINVDGVLTSGTISSTQTVCSGSNASTLNFTTAPTGGTGSYTYQWYNGSGALGSTSCSVASSPYEEPVTITNTSGSTLTNYQVLVTVTWNSHMKSDFSDLLFTDASCKNLSYWVQSYTASTTAQVWVKVPSIPTPGGATIYMYYGNAGATSQSSGINTFNFYDDGSNVASWSLFGGANAGSTTGQGNPVPSYFAYSNMGDYLYREDPGLTANTLTTFNVYSTSLGNFFFLCNSIGWGQMYRIDARGGANISGLATTTGWTAWGGPSGVEGIAASTWYQFGIAINSAETNATLYYQSTTNAGPTLPANSVGTYSITNDGDYIGLVGDGGGSYYTTYWDNIITRNYVSPEPSTSVGSEQSSGSSTGIGTGSTYNPLAITSTTNYYCVVTSGSCGTATTNTVTITVNPPPVPPIGANACGTSPWPMQISWNWSSESNATGYKWGTTNVYSSAKDNGTDTSYIQTNLICNTTYTLYVWAYNCNGNSSYTALTNITSPCSTTFTCGNIFTDSRDGQTYGTVQVGTQCWFLQNLKATKYINGTTIPNVTDQTAWNNMTSGALCDQNNDPGNVATYGHLYNGYAAMNSCGICPTGWYVPTYNDFNILFAYLGVGTAQYQWPSSTYFPYPYSGWRNSGGFGYLGYCATFWTSTEFAAGNLYARNIDYEYGVDLGGGYSDPTGGLAVRCIEDYCSMLPVSVTASASANPVCVGTSLTLTETDVYGTSWKWSGPNGYTSTLQSPTLSITGTLQGGVYTVTATSFCGTGTAGTANTGSVIVNASVPAAPTASTNITTQTFVNWNWSDNSSLIGYLYGTTSSYGSATNIGTINTYVQTGLSCGTVYSLYVWAYNACGNSLYTTLTQLTSSCGGYCTVTGCSGQVFMCANLNVGTVVAESITNPQSQGQEWCYNDLATNCITYGGLYQWASAANISNIYNSTYATPTLGATNESCNPCGPTNPSANLPYSGIQGICPAGFHIPSDLEWSQYEYCIENTIAPTGNTLLSTFQNSASYRGSTTAGVGPADKMKGGGITQWPGSYPGNDASGFYALSAGYFGASYVSQGGTSGITTFWSATEGTISTTSYVRSLYATQTRLMRAPRSKIWGLSVRCLQDCSAAPSSSPTAGTNTPSASQIVWNWNSVSGTSGYKWGTTNSYGSAIDNTTSTSYTQTGLFCSTIYTLYVWAYNGCGNSSYTTLTQSTSACCIFSNNGIISTIAGNGSGFSGDGGPATNAKLGYPGGQAAIDASGNVYFADGNNYRVRKVTIATGIISTVAGNGTGSYTGDGGAATSATLHNPEGVFIDVPGNLYIVDNMNNVIRKVIMSTGIINTIAGNGTGGYAGDGGPATTAELNGPDGVAVDASGNVYIADGQNNIIRKVTNSTGIISTIAGIPLAGGYGGDGGPATSAYLWGPYGVFVDGSGNVYISDEDNGRIRKVTNSTGIISTIAGGGGSLGDGGPATSAQLLDPWGVCVDVSGNVYFLDMNHYRVREICNIGLITTIAGNGTSGFSGDGGPATSAKISMAGGVVLDGSGNIYITDQFNNRIRKIVLP